MTGVMHFSGQAAKQQHHSFSRLRWKSWAFDIGFVGFGCGLRVGPMYLFCGLRVGLMYLLMVVFGCAVIEVLFCGP